MSFARVATNRGVWCHDAFAQNRHLHFPLVVEFEPKENVPRRYGAYCIADGFSERALFVADNAGESPGAIARAGIVADAFYAKDSAFVTY